jgi:hypothetical protein
MSIAMSRDEQKIDTFSSALKIQNLKHKEKKDREKMRKEFNSVIEQE